MDIREIDVNDDVQFRDLYSTMLAALEHGRPNAPMWSEREAAVMFRSPDLSEEWHAIAAYEGSEMVGAAELVFPLLDNATMAFLGAFVAPLHRRQGIGSALVGHCLHLAEKNGRTVLLGEANLPMRERDTHPYATFAVKNGFALANVEVRRDLPLPVSDATLAGWQSEAAPHHAAYRLETFVNELPDELLESFCYLTNQLAVDAPTGDVELEAEGLTPEAMKARQAKSKAQGRSVFETLALDSTGEVVAHSTLAVSADRPGTVFQWGTIVHRAHRGHRLGLAVKAKNLAAMQAAFPDQHRVVTCNSEHNDHMLAINITMGFEPVELAAEFQRKL